MKSYRNAVPFLIALTFALGLASESTIGHEIFQDILKEKYTLKSFSCKTCHQDSDNRKLRTPFADLYAEALKDGNWSAKWAEVEPKGEEAIAAFEKEIGEAFKKSLDNVGKKTLTVDDLFAAGLLAGVRVDEKKRKAMEAKSKKDSAAGSEKESPAGISLPSSEPPALTTSALTVSALTMPGLALSARTPRSPKSDSSGSARSSALVPKSDD